jgi:hypothetical protein
MNAIIRNSLLALTVVGSLSLAACKSDDTMDTSTPPPAAAAPEMQTPPPADASTMPPTTPPTDSSTPPTTP